jgi:hypothetical protein
VACSAQRAAPDGLDASTGIDGGAEADAAAAMDGSGAIGVAEAGADAAMDAALPTVLIGSSMFIDGVLDVDGGGTGFRPPSLAELLPLPGGGVGPLVVTSNNPEIVTGNGVLATTLQGDFGVYLHHLNQAGAQRSFSILVTNPNAAPVTVSLRGSGYSQGETGGLGLGASPDYRVSKEWITDQPGTATAPITISSGTGAVLWTKPAANNQEIDGRFALHASGPVYVYVLMANDGTLQQALAVSQPITDAPGDYRVSGTPPPPFGREAGVYANDTWRSLFDAELPAGPKHVSFMVNTATGAGLSQVQAFPALSHYTQSAAEAVGMYGNIYELDVGLRNTMAGATARRVRVGFHSLSTGSASRFWDGAALLDGALIDVRHVPGDVSTTLFDGMIMPGEIRRVHLRAMVPGLAAIPQALTIESF